MQAILEKDGTLGSEDFISDSCEELTFAGLLEEGDNLTLPRPNVGYDIGLLDASSGTYKLIGLPENFVQARAQDGTLGDLVVGDDLYLAQLMQYAARDQSSMYSYSGRKDGKPRFSLKSMGEYDRPTEIELHLQIPGHTVCGSVNFANSAAVDDLRYLDRLIRAEISDPRPLDFKGGDKGLRRYLRKPRNSKRLIKLDSATVVGIDGSKKRINSLYVDISRLEFMGITPDDYGESEKLPHSLIIDGQKVRVGVVDAFLNSRNYHLIGPSVRGLPHTDGVQTFEAAIVPRDYLKPNDC
jgi:hypothetical protein